MPMMLTPQTMLCNPIDAQQSSLGWQGVPEGVLGRAVAALARRDTKPGQAQPYPCPYSAIEAQGRPDGQRLPAHRRRLYDSC